MKLCKIPATLFDLFTKAIPLVFHQAPEARGGFLIIYQIGVYLVMVYRKTWLHIVLPLAFRINCIQNLNIIINRKAQQKKLKTCTGLDLSIHAKKEPKNLVRHSF
jgi:hypothetical protein